MYEELIKRLRELHPEAFGDKWDFAFACQQAMNDAADAIEELSRENDNLAKSVNEASEILRRRWIPVTERLPSPKKAVLVWTPYKQNIFMAYLQGNKWYVWGPGGNCCNNWPEYHAITHWMPLPEPPKEE